MKKWIFMAIILIAAIALSGCASSGGAAPSAPAEVELPPEGTERLTLANGALAIYRFDLPAGTTWGNYNKLTAEYFVDEVNITKSLRSNAIRVLGNYKESVFDPGKLECIVNLGDDDLFAKSIIVNWVTSWAGMNAVANEWFTIEYNLNGSVAHGQFNRANIPAANATGPFFFGLGISAQDDGRRNAITQLVRNITLHHATNPALNVVSTGSGFEVPTFASYYPVFSTRVANFE